jgi:hypothetical protein
MLFNVSLFNHSRAGQENILDAVFIIVHQLEALGHQVIFEPQKFGEFLGEEQGYNLIIENFCEDWILQTLSEVHIQGGRFIVIAMEEPTEGKGFNNSFREEFILRKKSFCLCKPYIDGILYLTPGEYTHNWYNQYAPAAFAELGYTETLIRPIYCKEPIYDFGFFGSIFGRRMAILKKLIKRLNNPKTLLAIGSFPSPQERDEEMQKVKVILQIRKRNDIDFVSSCKCNTALCLGRPTISEPVSMDSPWTDIINISKSEDSFLDEAIDLLNNWEFVYEKQFNMFKKNLSPEFCIGAPLKEIGVL